MNVVSYSFHAVGESCLVYLEMALSISIYCHPAIVNVNILIAEFIKTKVDYFISGSSNKLITYTTTEFVPSIPTHLRCQTETIIQSNCC